MNAHLKELSSFMVDVNADSEATRTCQVRKTNTPEVKGPVSHGA
jgi:hypothetical protein